MLPGLLIIKPQMNQSMTYSLTSSEKSATPCGPGGKELPLLKPFPFASALTVRRRLKDDFLRFLSPSKTTSEEEIL